jgi:hypothetical protein
MGAAASGQSVMTARDYAPREVARQKFREQNVCLPKGIPCLPSTTDTTCIPDTLVGCF